MDVERRTIAGEAEIEYRDGDEAPVIRGYAAVFHSESQNLGGFVETVHPRAFDKVLEARPDVLGVFNHDRNLLLGRTSNNRLKLWTDNYGLRYEITPNPNTTVGRDVIEWVKDRTVVGSSFAFAVKRDGGDAWGTNSNGTRHREIREVSLLEDVGPVSRPAYEAASVVVSRRAIEMALGDNFRPNQTMANAARRGLRSAKDADQRLVAIAERISERSILSVEEVEFLAAAHRRCHEVRSVGWKGTSAWVEWMLAGGDSGEAWVAKRVAAEDISVGDFVSWNSSGGRATGKITRIEPNETIEVPDTDVRINATPENPAVLIRVYRDGEPTDVIVGHRAAVLTKVSPPEEKRAEPEGLSEGDFASWEGGVGRVEHIMTGGSLQGMEASEEDPIAVLTPYEDGEPEDYMVAIRVADLAKVDQEAGEERAVSLRPSAGMASAARRGLRLHEQGKSGDGLKPETVARANKIARREELTSDHVREMNAWFARHESASKSPGWDTPGEEKPGFVAWLLWGGNAAKTWSASKVAQMKDDQRSEVAEVEVEAPAPEPEVVIDPAEGTALKLAGLQAALLRTKLQGIGSEC